MACWCVMSNEPVRYSRGCQNVPLPRTLAFSVYSAAPQPSRHSLVLLPVPRSASMVQVHQLDPHKVQEIRELKDKPNSTKASFARFGFLLQRIHAGRYVAAHVAWPCCAVHLLTATRWCLDHSAGS